MDNTGNRFSSAAEALNQGGRKAKGDYMMFVHQDVDLLFETWLENAEKILDLLDNLGVAGVAGFPENQEPHVIVSNIKDSIPPKPVGVNISKPKKVHSVDECLFFVPKKVFKEIQFDGETCSDWHLYGVDYCLSVQRRELSVYAIHSEIHHASRSNSFSREYYSTLKKITKKHGPYFKKIYTTCGVWNTNIYRLYINICEDWFKRRILHTR